MNRKYLLDSLDGLKGLIFRLLPTTVTDSLGCVPMTTDGPWIEGDKKAFETAIGIPSDRIYWMPGGFPNVPAASNRGARSAWVQAVANLNHPFLFLDPDTGFYHRHNGGGSEKIVLVTELNSILQRRDAVIVYRHQYWPKRGTAPIFPRAYPYVSHGLSMLRGAGLCAFAYQSQAASFFFVSLDQAGLVPFETGLRNSMAGMSSGVVDQRLVV